MARLSALDVESTSNSVEGLFKQVEEELGMVPAIYRVIANSPVVLDGLLAMQGRLETGLLDKALRVQIALAVSQANGSAYCVAAHTALGLADGLSDETMRDARRACAPNRRSDAVLKFSRALGERTLQPLDELLCQLRRVDFTDAEIIEIVTYTALVSLTNSIALCAHMVSDFPSIDLSDTKVPTITPPT